MNDFKSMIIIVVFENLTWNNIVQIIMTSFYSFVEDFHDVIIIWNRHNLAGEKKPRRLTDFIAISNGYQIW